MTLMHEIEFTHKECEIIEKALSSYMISFIKNPKFKEVSELHKLFAKLLGKED